MFLRGARQHNLKDIDLDLPDDRLVVITGVSGSGKSSLAFDTLYREAQRRYLETLSFSSRKHQDRAGAPALEQAGDLRPAVAVDQRTVIASARSTVGTLTELNPHLRLLLARLGQGAPGPIESSLFSFNVPAGQCPQCKGLGVEDRVDPDLLVAYPDRSIRQGALALTTPSGYLVYSQVTLEVLDQVCRAHGFSIDVPWRELHEDQRHVVLHGSDRIVIPFGKHPLESRLRWTGITARPRQEGHYRGIVPTIETILARKRNANALRFARSAPCSACGGARLRPEALGVTFHGSTIADLTALTVGQLEAFAGTVELGNSEAAVGQPLLGEIARRCRSLRALGLEHLRLDRGSDSLCGGEARRLRLATQLRSGLRGLLYVLDEPSVGLHPVDLAKLLGVLRELRDEGNSLVVVEHDPAIVSAADWVAEIGPGAGRSGGEVVRNGAPPSQTSASPAPPPAPAMVTRGMGNGALTLRGARARNLKGIEVSFRLQALNVVSGVAGAGKSTLVQQVLAPALQGKSTAVTVEAASPVRRVIVVDQRPIGRTPRSNGATYTKLYDHVRTLFAGLDEARSQGLGKGSFSFNTKGGRCETCQGAGVMTVGMHYLADVEVPCEACNGRRFNDETLAVRYRDHNIADVLSLSVDSAAELLSDLPPVRRLLQALQAVGLGYLPLGQPSTTLSGGEAQRVKLAAELGRPSAPGTIYILDEPTVGLHAADVAALLDTLHQLVKRGDTVVVVEHDLDVIRSADWVIDLGPGSGEAGGEVVATGPPGVIAACANSLTGAALRAEVSPFQPAPPVEPPPFIELEGVSVNNLHGVDVTIPVGKITAITGVSGSGKSSLAFGALAAEGQRRYAACLSTHARRFMRQARRPELAAARGLSPPVALGQRISRRNPRSTVGTLSGILDLYRLLYSRAGAPEANRPLPEPLSAGLLSFNHHGGACQRCLGLGSVTRCDPRLLVTHPGLPLPQGALDGTRTGAYYGEPDGQHMAILLEAAAAHGVDIQRPWRELNPQAQRLCLWGTGDQEYDVLWRYHRDGRRGEHRFQSAWRGLIHYVTEEYERKQADRRGEALRPLMAEQSCEACDGQRLRPEVLALRFAGLPFGELCRLSVRAARALFEGAELRGRLAAREKKVAAPLFPMIVRRLSALDEVGLPYLSLDRAVSTLSGGELQRVRLAAQMQGVLRDVIYVLDEPTVGLHPVDTARLIRTLQKLRDRGCTVVVVEHDRDIIWAADHVIDLGPGGGAEGGEVMAAGPPEAIADAPRSVTGTYLRRALGSFSGPHQPLVNDDGIVIRNAWINNLQGFDVTIPCGGMVAISGVSGSGKTSLLRDVIAATASQNVASGCDAVFGLERFDRVVPFYERAAAGAPTSTVASLVPGIQDELRSLFARSPEARALGLTGRHFALGSKGGRCEACRGAGWNRIGMGFLAEVRQTCPACCGARFEAPTLACQPETLGGRNIADVLDLTVSQARRALPGARLTRALAQLEDLGLGYVRVGQQARSLSGGEAQRVHLAARLLERAAGGSPTLLLLDEPTAGLHPHDVAALVPVLRGLPEAGHTVIVVEHDLDLISAADHILDLGPDSGERGGQLVAQGSTKELMAAADSRTGAALRRARSQAGASPSS